MADHHGLTSRAKLEAGLNRRVHVNETSGCQRLTFHGTGTLPQRSPRLRIERPRPAETITVLQKEDDVPILGIMRLMERGGAFDFWKEEGEDIYSAADGEPV